MTIEEAITECGNIADLCEDQAKRCDLTDPYESAVAGREGECAHKHRQIAEWLKDYKRLKEQKPKPMMEIDLYSVIKQKYIEREVLDKIKSEIEEIETYDGLYIDRAYVLQIIDKYKAESEDKDA